jgi:hypothetical protein
MVKNNDNHFVPGGHPFSLSTPLSIDGQPTTVLMPLLPPGASFVGFSQMFCPMPAAEASRESAESARDVL